MVFRSKNYTLNFDNSSHPSTGGAKRHIATLSATIFAFTATCLPSLPAIAENAYTTEFVDAFAPEGTPQGDKFNEAEQALSMGLSGRVEKPSKPSFPSAAEIKQVVATKPVDQAPMIRRVKSPVEDVDPFLDPEAAPVPRIQQESLNEAESLINEAAPIPQAKPKLTVAKEPQVVAKLARKDAPQKETTTKAAKASKSAVNAINALQDTLSQSENKVRDLERQLSEAKGQLAAAELEINRLSSIIQGNSRARLAVPTNSAAAAVSNVAPQPVAKRALPAPAQPVSAPVDSVIPKLSADAIDVQVATISVEKADLRLGPGKNHSALMSLRKGSRLAIEARQGEWYRVFAPNGQRAWIHSSLVRFGDGAASMNDGSSVKVRGFDARAR
jgi:hypothetical protein